MIDFHFRKDKNILWFIGDELLRFLNRSNYEGVSKENLMQEKLKLYTDKHARPYTLISKKGVYELIGDDESIKSNAVKGWIMLQPDLFDTKETDDNEEEQYSKDTRISTNAWYSRKS